MAPVALVVMNAPVVVGMADVFKPGNVDMGPSVVIGRLVFAAPSVRMRHHRQLAGQIPQHQYHRRTATQYDPLRKAAGFDTTALTSSRN